MDLSAEEYSLLRLSLTSGVTAVTRRGLLDLFGSAKSLYDATPTEMQKEYGVGSQLVQTLHSSQVRYSVDEQIRCIEEESQKGNVVRLLFTQSAGYPESLDACPDAPIVLYIKGQLPTSQPMIGIVGTRKNTLYAEDSLRYFMQGFADARPDLVIVSGLAVGVDAISHRFAIELDLPTVAVVAHGLDSLYPACHRQLANQIIEKGGGILTEYPFGVRALPQRFIARNRIVSGLTIGLLVAESASRGGALSTASFSLDYGRSVYAIPGRLFDSKSEGCNELIRLNKAAIALTPLEILKDLNLIDPVPVPHPRMLPFDDSDLQCEKAIGEEESTDPLLALLKAHESLSINDLAMQTGESIGSLSSKLFMLEMNGEIRSLPGGNYSVIPRK